MLIRRLWQASALPASPMSADCNSATTADWRYWKSVQPGRADTLSRYACRQAGARRSRFASPKTPRRKLHRIYADDPTRDGDQDSPFLQKNAAAAGVKGESWTAAIDFSLKHIWFVFALHKRGDRQFRLYPAPAGLRIHVHGNFVRQTHFDAAAGGLEPAIAGRLVRNAGSNRTAGGDRLERTLYLRDVDVAARSLHHRFAVLLPYGKRTSGGLGGSVAHHFAEVNAAAGSLDVHVALATRDSDAAARGASKDRAFDLPEFQAAARSLTSRLACQIGHFDAPAGGL